jgi:hypothetical protein
MVIIRVSKDEVERCDPSRIADIFREHDSNLLQNQRNKVQIDITGYNEDPRNMWEIPEAGNFYQALFNEIPELFYWIDINSYMFFLLGIMVYPPLRAEGGVTLSSEDLQAYLVRGIEGLNRFCKQRNLSTEPTDQAINEKLALM